MHAYVGNTDAQASPNSVINLSFMPIVLDAMTHRVVTRERQLTSASVFKLNKICFGYFF